MSFVAPNEHPVPPLSQHIIADHTLILFIPGNEDTKVQI